MEKTFEGKTYEAIPETHKSSCLECVAFRNEPGINLCETLRANNVCADNNVIWREKVIKIVPVAKNKYKTAAELFTEWRDGTSLIEFTEWCNQKADPEYAEYQRLKAKFKE
jgi:hypothetical protein